VSIERSPSCSNPFTGVQSEATPNVQPRSEAFENDQNRSEMIAHHEIRKTSKTNPNSPADPLSPRQLAAARLVCQGMRTIYVARELTTTVQTVNRWRRMPAFAHEVRRLHELLARGSISQAPSTRAPRPAEKSITKFDQAEMSAFVAESLEKYGWK